MAIPIKYVVRDNIMERSWGDSGRAGREGDYKSPQVEAKFPLNMLQHPYPKWFAKFNVAKAASRVRGYTTMSPLSSRILEHVSSKPILGFVH